MRRRRFRIFSGPVAEPLLHHLGQLAVQQVESNVDGTDPGAYTAIVAKVLVHGSVGFQQGVGKHAPQVDIGPESGNHRLRP